MRQPAPGPSLGVAVQDSAAGRLPLRVLLLLSAVFLAVQVAVTDHGPAHVGAAGLWFVVGCLLLVLVYRRHSRVARVVIVATSLVGAVVFGLAALEDASAAVSALAYLGQAVPLVMKPVREHVLPRP